MVSWHMGRVGARWRRVAARVLGGSKKMEAHGVCGIRDKRERIAICFFLNKKNKKNMGTDPRPSSLLRVRASTVMHSRGKKITRTPDIGLVGVRVPTAFEHSLN